MVKISAAVAPDSGASWDAACSNHLNDFCAVSGDVVLYVDQQVPRTFPPNDHTRTIVRAFKWDDQQESGVLLSHRYEHMTTVTRLRVSADGAMLVTGCVSGEVVCWCVQSESRNWSTLQLDPKSQHSGQIWCLELDPSNPACTQQGAVLTGSRDCSIRAFSLFSGRALWVILNAHAKAVRCMSFVPPNFDEGFRGLIVTGARAVADQVAARTAGRLRC